MTRLDTSSDTHIQRDWLKSIVLMLLCMLLVPFFWYGIHLDPTSLPDHRLHNASFVMFPIFVVSSLFTLFRLFVPWGAPVRISPEGIVDLRAGSKVIPWQEISNVVRKGEFVTLTLKRNFAKSYRLTVTQKIVKSMRKSAGPSHVLIADWCLQTRETNIEETVLAYWEAATGGRAS